MIEYKKTTMVVLALSSGVVFAGAMGSPCGASNVAVPCVNSGWAVGAQALYLKPSYSGLLSFVGSNVNELNTVSGVTTSRVTSEKYAENNLEWSWSFKLEAAYHFYTGNDLNLNWYHLGEKTTHSNVSDLTREINSTESESTANSIQPGWDAVNLEFGQRVDLGMRKKIRLHGGAQYARINSQLSTLHSATTVDTLNSSIGHVAETGDGNFAYNGFGPRVGVDMSYDVGRDFAIFANGAAAILMGTSKFTLTTNQRRTTENLPDINIASDLVTGRKTALVPALEGQLGLQYTHALNRGNVTVDAGYMWVNYFDALVAQFFDMNFGIQGPFVRLKWRGNIA